MTVDEPVPHFHDPDEIHLLAVRRHTRILPHERLAVRQVARVRLGAFASRPVVGIVPSLPSPGITPLGGLALPGLGVERCWVALLERWWFPGSDVPCCGPRRPSGRSDPHHDGWRYRRHRQCRRLHHDRLHGHLPHRLVQHSLLHHRLQQHHQRQLRRLPHRERERYPPSTQ
jgi:hypothetical protein